VYDHHSAEIQFTLKSPSPTTKQNFGIQFFFFNTFQIYLKKINTEIVIISLAPAVFSIFSYTIYFTRHAGSNPSYNMYCACGILDRVGLSATYILYEYNNNNNINRSRRTRCSSSRTVHAR